MMVVKGVNVWPSQIEAVLLKQGYQANYQILVDRIGNNDTIEVQVEMTPEMNFNSCNIRMLMFDCYRSKMLSFSYFSCNIEVINSFN